MGRKLFISASLSFSVIIILLGGYNCASQYEIPGHGDGPGQPHNPDNPTGPPNGDPPPPGTAEDGCDRTKYREFADRHGATSAYIVLDKSNFEDFNLGRPTNFSVSCTRMMLNMNPVSGSRTYKGKLYILYDERYGNGIKPQALQYGSGSSEKDNQYNKWYGDWRASRRGQTTAKFNAIFQQERTVDMAIILQINKVEEVDEEEDGVFSLRGHGDIWFKMFRIFETTSDKCNRNGVYVRYEPSGELPRPRWPCWFTPSGAYGCRPEGTISDYTFVNRLPYSEKSIDIRSEPECYSKFGEFLNLDINRAFNVPDNRDHP